MDIKLIRDEEGLQRAFSRMEELWGAKTGTDGDYPLPHGPGRPHPA